ncbi:MAG: glycosyltransferase family 2 protein, partial [Deltaproteobacteria bacterium]|nr:glycosyltransferase family 2 protein [Deltaproteobacteria bacterium]
MHSVSPKLTINMTVYNEEKYMRTAIQSLIEQTYTNFRLVIANNGSTDGTLEIARHFADRDSRIAVINLETNDPLYSFELFKAVETEFFMGAAGHDFYAPQYIEKCIDALEADPGVVLAYSKARWLKDDNIFGEIPDLIVSRYSNNFSRPLLVAYGLNEAYQCYGVFRVPPLRLVRRHNVVGFDHVMLSELASYGAFALVNEPLFFMRQAESYGDANVYRKKHLPNEPDGVGAFLKMTSAYMSIAELVSEPRDQTIMKMAFFTMSLLRYRGILDMFGESVDSLFAKQSFRELETLMTDTVSFIEQNLQREYG